MFREHHPDNRSLMFLADHQQYHHPSANTALRARVSPKASHSMTVTMKTMGYKKMQVTPVNTLTSLTETHPLPLWYSTIHSKAPAGDSARTVKERKMLVNASKRWDDEMLMQMLVIMTASGTGRSDFFLYFSDVQKGINKGFGCFYGGY